MISKSYRKCTTFPKGDYTVFFMEDYLSNKDSSDAIIGLSPVGNLAYKICRHRLYTGCKDRRIIGVSGFRHKRRKRPFSVYEECAQLSNVSSYRSKNKPHKSTVHTIISNITKDVCFTRSKLDNINRLHHLITENSTL